MRRALLLSLLALSGCGLQLAEREPLPEALRTVRLQIPADARSFAAPLADALAARGVSVVSAAEGDAALLVIHRLRSEERVLSVSATGTPLEKELALSVDFSLPDPSGALTARQSLVLTRDMTWDATQVLAKEREAELLLDALTAEAARRIVSRYARAGG